VLALAVGVGGGAVDKGVELPEGLGEPGKWERKEKGEGGDCVRGGGRTGGKEEERREGKGNGRETRKLKKLKKRERREKKEKKKKKRKEREEGRGKRRKSVTCINPPKPEKISHYPWFLERDWHKPCIKRICQDDRLQHIVGIMERHRIQRGLEGTRRRRGLRRLRCILHRTWDIHTRRIALAAAHGGE